MKHTFLKHAHSLSQYFDFNQRQADNCSEHFLSIDKFDFEDSNAPSRPIPVYCKHIQKLIITPIFELF